MLPRVAIVNKTKKDNNKNKKTDKQTNRQTERKRIIIKEWKSEIIKKWKSPTKECRIATGFMSKTLRSIT